MNNLYYGSDDVDIDCFRNASFKFDTDVLATFLRRIYNGFDTSKDVEPTMWREILRIINEATVDGLVKGNYDTNIDKTFLQKLAHSNEVFSAFKVHNMGVDMAKKMRTDDGKLKPFSEWKKDIKPIASHYCGAWLQTEYNTATLRAKFAAEWKQYEADADIFPNLRWMPTTSATPEEEHKGYWMNRLTLPIGDKFWDKHHPGDHWNCKCSLEQTDHPANPDVLSHIPDVKPQKGLAANPGKTGEMFDKEHPYFPKDCAHCSFRRGLKNMFVNADKHCNNCNTIDGALDKFRERKAVIDMADMELTPEQKHEVFMRPLEEQFVEVSPGVMKHVLKATNGDYPTLLKVAESYADKEGGAYILPEIHSSEKDVRKRLGLPSPTKTPDIKLLSGILVDVKSPEQYDNIIRNANKASRQGAIACLTDEEETCAIKLDSLENLTKKILREKDYTQDEVHYYVKGKLYKYNSRGIIPG